MISSNQSKKDRQCNGQAKRAKKKNNDLQTTAHKIYDWATRSPLKWGWTQLTTNLKRKQIVRVKIKLFTHIFRIIITLKVSTFYKGPVVNCWTFIATVYTFYHLIGVIFFGRNKLLRENHHPSTSILRQPFFLQTTDDVSIASSWRYRHGFFPGNNGLFHGNQEVDYNIRVIYRVIAGYPTAVEILKILSE